MNSKVEKLKKDREEVRAKIKTLSQKEKELTSSIEKLEAQEVNALLSNYNVNLAQLESILKQNASFNGGGIQ